MFSWLSVFAVASWCHNSKMKVSQKYVIWGQTRRLCWLQLSQQTVWFSWIRAAGRSLPHVFTYSRSFSLIAKDARWTMPFWSPNIWKNTSVSARKIVVALVYCYFCHRFPVHYLQSVPRISKDILYSYIFIHFICSVYAVMSIFMKGCLICHIDSYQSLWNHVQPCSFEICVLHDVLPGRGKTCRQVTFHFDSASLPWNCPFQNLQVDEEKRPTRVNILQKLQWLVRTDPCGLHGRELVVQTDRELVQ